MMHSLFFLSQEDRIEVSVARYADELQTWKSRFALAHTRTVCLPPSDEYHALIRLNTLILT